MHIYHMLGFELGMDDLFHHLLFVPVIGPSLVLAPFARRPIARGVLAQTHLTLSSVRANRLVQGATPGCCGGQGEFTFPTRGA